MEAKEDMRLAIRVHGYDHDLDARTQSQSFSYILNATPVNTTLAKAPFSILGSIAHSSIYDLGRRGKTSSLFTARDGAEVRTLGEHPWILPE
jgi:hypothetical protein